MTDHPNPNPTEDEARAATDPNLSTEASDVSESRTAVAVVEPAADEPPAVSEAGDITADGSDAVDVAPEASSAASDSAWASAADSGAVGVSDAAASEAAPEYEVALESAAAPESEATVSEATASDPEAAAPVSQGTPLASEAATPDAATAAPDSEAATPRPEATGSPATAPEAGQASAAKGIAAAPAQERAEKGRNGQSGRPGQGPRQGQARPGQPGRPGGRSAGGRPRPAPRPGPRPSAGAPRPAAPEAVPVAAPSDPTPWGRVGDDGSVFVKDAAAEGGERFVGSYPNAPHAEALSYYGRKFDELAGLIDLAEQRMGMPNAPVKEITKELRSVREQLSEAAVVGDLEGLAKRLESLEGGLAERRAAVEAERAEAKAQAQVARAALVHEAEQIAGTDVKRMQWKQATERMVTLFEQWKTEQRDGVKLDKPVEDELWHTFSHARTTFDRARRHHFAQLHHEHSEAKSSKEKLIAEAEALSSSTDWAGTSIAYRQLLDRWKQAGRAGRKDDDALWARFRAAQDVFFAARGADNAKTDAELTANLEVKEKLLSEAEALLPIKDLRAAKSALRSIQERWESAGKVPRADVQRVERRLKAVEQAVRDREDERWKRSNPETKARTEGALGQLRDAIAGLEADLATARQRGDARRIAEAEQALAARRTWLETLQRTARDIG